MNVFVCYADTFARGGTHTSTSQRLLTFEVYAEIEW